MSKYLLLNIGNILEINYITLWNVYIFKNYHLEIIKLFEIK